MVYLHSRSCSDLAFEIANYLGPVFEGGLPEVNVLGMSPLTEELRAILLSIIDEKVAIVEILVMAQD